MSAYKVIFICIAVDPYITTKVRIKAVYPVEAKGSNSEMKHT